MKGDDVKKQFRLPRELDEMLREVIAGVPGLTLKDFYTALTRDVLLGTDEFPQLFQEPRDSVVYFPERKAEVDAGKNRQTRRL